MMDYRDIAPRLPESSNDTGALQNFPKQVVWLAALMIVLLAGIGAYKGVLSTRRSDGLQSVPATGGGKTVEATVATPLPRDQWATNGQPAPEPAKAAVKAKSQDAASDEAPDPDDAAEANAPTPTVKKPTTAEADDKTATADTPIADSAPGAADR